MTDDKPIIYILHGDDSFAINQFLTVMIGKMGDPAMAELNITHLDGKTASEDDLRSAALSMPFLAERRMVIVMNPLARYTPHRSQGATQDEPTAPASETGKAARERYLAFLDSVPQSTALVLVVSDAWVKKKTGWDWEVLSEKHWLVKWAHQAGNKVFLKPFQLPRGNAMTEWISKQAKEQGGQFTPQAASALSNQIGNDTQLAAIEVQKLLTYVNFSRPVEIEDVELLTSQTRQEDMFAMVDALGNHEGHQASRILHRLLDDEDPFFIYGMVLRQFRLILQAREILDEGGGEAQVAQEMHQAKFVVDKITEQAERFSMPELIQVYHRLLEIDQAIKTSQMDWVTALDVFTAEIAMSR